MKRVGELLRDASTPRDAFGDLVQVIDAVFPVHALAIVSAATNEEPLVWTSGTPGLEPIRVATVAGATLDWFRVDPPLDIAPFHATSPTQPWLSMPIVANEGAIVGLLAIAPAYAVDEATLAFVSSVATSLAALLVRGAQLEQVYAARERTEWLSRATDLRLIEERRARSAAEWSAHALGVASDATAVLLSSFDYAAVLRHVVRIVAEHLACGCVVDVQERDGIDRIAQVASHPEPTVARAIAPLVADVRRRCDSAVSIAGAAPPANGDPRYAIRVAERARRALGVEWIVSVPMSSNGTSAVGVLTMFGSGPRHEPIPLSIAEELGRRSAIAVENGRRYLSAVAALHQREQVLSMVSHDLKNPLGVILMSVAHVLEEMPERERRGRGRPQLELIQRSARRMMKLVGDLLDLAAMDAGQISMVPRHCSLRALVLEAFEEIGPQASAAGVELACEVGDGLPPAWADSHRITQVLMNLLSNALKFTPQGGRISARAEVLPGNQLAVMIDDTGQGIRADHLAHIFDRYWQGPMTAKTGSGLGLAICRGMIERSGGRIWAESIEGIGTTFTFTLPIA
jgi:signal transduction histidine kinase